ncbi:ribosomal lysine N-methyltransferase 4 [Favolaschia claudopus]|uniref:Ribosomal lysine N-methyltransferase 4 n=1 Tax=Favolaschia claudopus TaxID=2862362 RepID=A0AAW0A4N4_9AGAR
MAEDTVAGLLDWFEASGGSLDRFSVGFTAFHGCGRGAVALRNIPEGHVLFKIPRNILLSTETSTLPSLVGLDRWREAKMHLGWVGLILCMMWESAQGSNSRWSKYLESLPEMFDTPMFWGDHDLEELKGTSVVEKLGKVEAEKDFEDKLLPMVQSRPDIFLPDTIPVYYTLEVYHLMGSRILSRSFDVETDESYDDEPGPNDAADTSVGSAMEVDHPQEDAPAEDSEQTDDNPEEEGEEEEPSGVSMVPLADMLNARYGADNAKLFYEKDELRMVSTKPIAAGEQIWNTYGDLPNAELLRRYGHVDMLPLPDGDLGNPGDVVEIPADLAVSVLQTDSVVTKERIDWWLEQGGDDVVVLETDLEIPLALVSLIRLLRLTGDEWEKTKAKDKVPKPKIEADILDVVRAVLERRLAEYPSSLEDDRQLLRDETLSLNKKHALVVRIGEKKILRDTLREVQKQIEASKGSGGGNKKRKVVPDGGDTGRASKRR